MKKISIILFLFVLFSLTSCEKEHVHNLKKETIEPTCEFEGFDYHYCECGYNYRNNYIKPHGHNESDWIIMFYDMQKYKKCLACEKVLVKEYIDFYQLGEMFNFEFVWNKTTPICFNIRDKETNDILFSVKTRLFDQTYLKGTCYRKECYTYTACVQLGSYNTLTDKIEIYGNYEEHYYTDWIILTEPTATTNGLKRRSCLTCYKDFYEEIVCLQNVEQKEE